MSALETALREEFHKIMEITGCEEEQTYVGMADKVKAWGSRQYAEGLIDGRKAPLQKG